MLDTIDTVFRIIGSWTEPLRELSPDIRDPLIVVIVLGLAALIAIGGWNRL